MGLESMNGQMEGFTTECTRMTRSVVMEFISGKMTDSMKGGGLMESRMGLGSTLQRGRSKMGCGKVENGSNGLMTRKWS